MDLLEVEGVAGAGVEHKGVLDVGQSLQLAVSASADVAKEGGESFAEGSALVALDGLALAGGNVPPAASPGGGVVVGGAFGSGAEPDAVSFCWRCHW
jgi:hypothetical protein